LPPDVRIPFPEAEIVATAADKSKVLALAEQIGVPTPKMLVVNSPQEIDSILPRVEYPAVFKPARSRAWTGERWISGGTGYSQGADDLRARLNSLHPAIFPILIQERIEGPGVGVFVCCGRDSQILATFAHRRLREKPPSGGVSVLCESAPVDPVAKAHAIHLLQRIGWLGVAMVEFKQDSRDGSLKLMEINGRFWGSLQLAIDAGVNFPRLAADIALGAVTPVDGYRIGVRSRWFWGDVDAMLALLLRSRAQLNLPHVHPGRWRTLLSFLKLWQPRMRYELERGGDPRPALLAARRWLLNRD
jgi:predicted ATP-grasp superfamily ATP-dependent carboligase